MVARATPVPANATEFGAGQAVSSGLGTLSERIRALENGSNRGPGSSFEMPFKLVGPTGVWTFDENADGVVVASNDLTDVGFVFTKEIVFSYPGVVDTIDSSGPWASASDIVIKSIVILARVAATTATTWQVFAEVVTLPAGMTSVTADVSIPVAANTPFYAQVSNVGSSNAEDVTVIVRYIEQ